jgi:hypothetical protein
MIVAHIRLENDEFDWFDGPCELPILPPIGGHIRAMDRNANMRMWRVIDIVIQAVSVKLDEETPGGIRPLGAVPLRIEIICSEFG